MTVLVDDQLTLAYTAQVNVPAVSEARYLLITNDSQYRLYWYYDGRAAEIHVLAPYSELQNEQPAAPDGGLPSAQVGATGWNGRINFYVSLVPGVAEDASPPASALLVEGFALPVDGDRRTVRQVAQVPDLVQTAHWLQGDGQFQQVTTSDQSGDPYLQPAQPSRRLGLAALNSGGFPVGGLVVDTDGFLLIEKGVKFFNGFTAGAVGVPVVRAAVVGFHVTTTAGPQTVLNYTTDGVDALYRIALYMLVKNPTTPNHISCGYQFTDTTGVTRTRFFLFEASASMVPADGATNISSDFWPAGPVTIAAQANSLIVVTYRDPTGTPNDFVSAAIERLA